MIAEAHIADLGDGILDGTLQDLLTVATGRAVLVKSITLTNISATDRTVDVYVKRGGRTARHVGTNNMTCRAKQSIELYDLDLALRNGDKIQAQAEVASAIEWTMSGEEVSQ